MKPPNHTEWLLWQLSQILDDLEKVEYPSVYDRRESAVISEKLDAICKKWGAK